MHSLFFMMEFELVTLFYCGNRHGLKARATRSVLILVSDFYFEMTI
jgi:hypothetical protein